LWDSGRVLHKQQVRLVSQGHRDAAIAPSFIQVGEHYYPLTLRVDYEGIDTLKFGYGAATEQMNDLDSDIWRGLRVTIGPRGVQGLQFVDRGGTCSRWYMQTEDLPQIDYLVSQYTIVALDFGLVVSILGYVSTETIHYLTN
jgi:hypothetical protein